MIVDGNRTDDINTGGAYMDGNVSAGKDFVGRGQVVNNYFGTAPDTAPSLVTTPEGRKLYGLLDRHFSTDEIAGLCFELGVNWDNLKGETKAGKVRALIQHSEKNDTLAALKLMRVQRPNLRDQLTS